MNGMAGFMRIWNNKLYNLQLEAPDARPIECPYLVSRCASYLGSFYHGKITREAAAKLMAQHPSGAFLVRDVSSNLGRPPKPDCYALAIKYKDEVKTFLLYFNRETRQFHVGEKMFDTVELLVKDGLIHFHIEDEGAEVLKEIAEANIYESTPYRLRYQLVKSPTPNGPDSRRQSISITDSGINPHKPLRSNGPSYGQPRLLSEAVAQAKTQKTKGDLSSADAGSCNDDSSYPEQQQQWPSNGNGYQQLQMPSPKFKEHTFKLYTFVGANWCDYCNNFLWGLISQGMRCSDCGFQAHKKCAERSLQLADCLPDMKYMRRVFAVDLISLVRAEGRKIPLVLEKCILEVEKRGGLGMEGIYRIPGNLDAVEELRKSFDKDAYSVDLTIESKVNDVNVFTSLIKLFMRQLPNPLIPYEKYEDFVQIAKQDDLPDKVKMTKYRETVHRLPLEHYQTLKFFLAHINRIASNTSVNKMTADNLAIVLTPSLIVNSYADPRISLKYEHSVIERLISQFDFIFPDLNR